MNYNNYDGTEADSIPSADSLESENYIVEPALNDSSADTTNALIQMPVDQQLSLPVSNNSNSEILLIGGLLLFIWLVE